jgi:hypothetical protein
MRDSPVKESKILSMQLSTVLGVVFLTTSALAGNPMEGEYAPIQSHRELQWTAVRVFLSGADQAIFHKVREIATKYPDVYVVCYFLDKELPKWVSTAKKITNLSVQIGDTVSIVEDAYELDQTPALFVIYPPKGRIVKVEELFRGENWLEKNIVPAIVKRPVTEPKPR